MIMKMKMTIIIFVTEISKMKLTKFLVHTLAMTKMMTMRKMVMLLLILEIIMKSTMTIVRRK